MKQPKGWPSHRAPAPNVCDRRATPTDEGRASQRREPGATPTGLGLRWLSLPTKLPKTTIGKLWLAAKMRAPRYWSYSKSSTQSLSMADRSTNPQHLSTLRGQVRLSGDQSHDLSSRQAGQVAERAKVNRRTRTKSATQRREARENRSHKFYRPHPRYDAAHCFYCGQLPTGIDHVPPLVAFDPDGPCTHNGHDAWLVPACRQCNYRLGPKPIFDIMDRIEYLGRSTALLIEILDNGGKPDAKQRQRARRINFRMRQRYANLDRDQLQRQLDGLRAAWRRERSAQPF